MTQPNNVPNSIGLPGGAPMNLLGVSAYLSQIVQGLNVWIGRASLAINAANPIGTYLSSTVAQASAVSLTNEDNANVTTLTLAAGDWDVSGTVYFVQSSANLATQLSVATAAASEVLPVNTLGLAGYSQWGPAAAGDIAMMPVGPERFNLTVSTIIYLVAKAAFPSGTVGAYGTLQARRWR